MFSNLEVILLILIIPLLAGLFSRIIYNRNLRSGINAALSGILSCFFLVIIMKPQNFLGQNINIFQLTKKIGFSLYIDQFSLSFASLISFLWFVSVGYSYFYAKVNDLKNLNDFDCYFSLSIFATLGLAISKNFLTSFMFYELLTLFSYPLVLHLQDKNSKLAARQYIIYLLGSSVLLLLAVILVYSNSINIDYLTGGILRSGTPPGAMVLLLFLVVYGCTKSAIFPLHRWLLGAMAAPVPVSALLHAVAVVKAGAFLIIRYVNDVSGFDIYNNLVAQNGYLQALVYIVSFSVVYASVMMAREQRIKSILAYSTIASLSGIALMALTFSATGIIAAMFMLIAHSFSKIILFMSYGSFNSSTGKTEKSELIGLIKTMPYTALVFCAGCFAIFGFPPFLISLAKFVDFAAAISSFSYVPFVSIAIASILSAYTYGGLVLKMVTHPEKIDRRKKPDREYFGLIIPQAICLIALIIFFLLSSSFIRFILTTYV